MDEIYEFAYNGITGRVLVSKWRKYDYQFEERWVQHD